MDQEFLAGILRIEIDRRAPSDRQGNLRWTRREAGMLSVATVAGPLAPCGARQHDRDKDPRSNSEIIAHFRTATLVRSRPCIA